MRATSKDNASSPEAVGVHKEHVSKRRANAEGSENVVFLHPAATEPRPTAQYLNQSVDIEALPMPIARFPGLMGVVPEQETIFCGLSAL